MTWIQTYTGRAWDLARPIPEDVCIEDVAHALSQLCRFTGHTTQFYSVAQHSVLVSLAIEKALPGRNQIALAGLLHDAEEAYLGDWSRPLKQLLRGMKPAVRSPAMPVMNVPGPWDYIERIVERHKQAIAEWAGLMSSFQLEHSAIKAADAEALATELRDLLVPLQQKGRQWGELPEPWPERIRPWPADKAERMFRERFEQLMEAAWGE